MHHSSFILDFLKCFGNYLFKQECSEEKLKECEEVHKVGLMSAKPEFDNEKQDFMQGVGIL